MRKSLSKCEAWRIAWLLTLLLICSFAHADKFTYVYTAPDGTVLAEADEQGNITKTYDYRPYGEQALGQPPGGPGYTGHVNDPDTGLVYMQARYYDPEMGRFLSPDPAGSKPGNTFGFNRYAYANNNPILNVDPNGRQTIPLANRLGTDNPSITDAYFSTQANFAVSLFCGCDASYHAPPGSGAVQSVLTPIETSLAGAVVSRGLGAVSAASDASKIVPEITADEIRQINRSLGGTTELTGNADTVIANMAYRESAQAKAAVAIRDIAGRHLFDDANKRTAQAVAERVLGPESDPTKIRSVIDDVGTSQLRGVDDIDKALGH